MSARRYRTRACRGRRSRTHGSPRQARIQTGLPSGPIWVIRSFPHPPGRRHGRM